MATRKKASGTGKAPRATKTTAKKKSGNARAAARPDAKSKEAAKKPSSGSSGRTRYLPPDKEERGLERARNEAGRENLHWERNRQVVLSEGSTKPN